MEHEDAPLKRNASFWALNGAQFLGAFNDSLFKQVVLLLCVDHVLVTGGPDLQWVGSALFAGPFVLLSGLAGMLSDRCSKRTVIVGCKVAEVGIVSLGVAALATGQLWGPLAVLGLLGVHSAFFGPSKYGVLPELVPPRDLPAANGIVLMATFLAIILGMATGGAALQFGKWMWDGRVWPVGVACLVPALVGWWCASRVRPLPPADPHLRFSASGLFLSRDTFRSLRRNGLVGCLLASAVFWFSGGMVYPPAINRLGKDQLVLGDLLTACLAAGTGVGIALGCVLAGRLCRRGVRGWVVRFGAWGLIGCLALLAMPGPNRGATLLGTWGSAAALVGLGLFAGFFSLPLQVHLQTQAPVEQKGRVVAAMNLFNWIGIALSAGFYAACDALLRHWGLPRAALFGCAAVVLLVVAVVFRPPEGTRDQGE